jgi:Domain of unknown function (DUF5658)
MNVPTPQPKSWTSWAIYPNHYAWYVLAGTLDILLTHFIVSHLGGGEANELARRILVRHGWPGLVALKYSTVIVVIIVCEIVGRKNKKAGRRLALAAVVLSALPVGLGLLQAWAWTHDLMPSGH